MGWYSRSRGSYPGSICDTASYCQYDPYRDSSDPNGNFHAVTHPHRNRNHHPLPNCLSDVLHPADENPNPDQDGGDRHTCTANRDSDRHSHPCSTHPCSSYPGSSNRIPNHGGGARCGHRNAYSIILFIQTETGPWISLPS